MPARLRNIRKAAKAFGIEITEPGRGSHWQCRREGFRMYTIPAHNGLKTEIADKYIAGFCRHFELDEAAVRAKL